MDEVLLAFLAECFENLEKLDNELVVLEKEPEGSHVLDALAKIFRTVHTIKGSCGWLGLSRLESVVHDGEELLVSLREEKIPVTTEIVNVLLEMFDAIREILNTIMSTNGQEGNTDYTGLIQRLKDAQTPTNIVSPGLANSVPQKLALSNEPHITSLDEKSEQNLQKEMKLEKQSAQQSTSSGAMESIRVDLKLLDKLMNLVGELVLTRNQMLQFTSAQEDAGFNITTQKLNIITSELQEGVMKTRMQMIGTIWNKYPRLIRDLALECGKSVILEMEGKETELDRTLIETIKDPLTHILRNAIDHGIENPDFRLGIGKPSSGKLSLKAFHEGGQINITIQDDGAGLNPEKLKERAIQNGLINAVDAAQMSERAIFNLIFLPGFSTAEKVTNISGRGVGMDVVKHNIESVGGSIDLSSKLGQGSTFKIKIPLTLAIIPALMLSSGGERFAIPQVNLLELVSLEGENVKSEIEMIYNSPVYRLRGKLLPLVYLNQELSLGSNFSDLMIKLEQAKQDARLNIVVLQADDQNFGLIVDEINDTSEIVVKPLSKQFKNLSVYSGATILGDGKVALIIDVMGFAQRVKVISESQKRGLQAGLEIRQESASVNDSLLLFYAVGERKMVLPLKHVARLEEISPDQVEFAGDVKVIQYRQQILPLIFLSEVLPVSNRVYVENHQSQTSDLQVIVCVEGDLLAGIVVEKILDIVDSDKEVEFQHNFRREGVLGSMILQGSVTEVLDFKDIIHKQIPSFFEETELSHQKMSVVR
ncbi:MAG: chemotaxis protein CheW [Candidatus Sericytochromatia bacterium]